VMATRVAKELLYDSEASLRLVDTALAELRTQNGPDDAGADVNAGLAGLPALLLRAYTEINGALQTLRQSRTALEHTAVEKLHLTSAKLKEVSSATELAATDILDGLDRAIAMVDELESAEAEGDTGRSGEVRQTMRDELFGLMGHLQFQDITTQQLNYASSILTEMENRLMQIARIFDPSLFGLEVPNTASDQPAVAFDPAATTHDAETRQALVDQIFG